MLVLHRGKTQKIKLGSEVLVLQPGKNIVDANMIEKVKKNVWGAHLLETGILSIEKEDKDSKEIIVTKKGKKEVVE